MRGISLQRGSGYGMTLHAVRVDGQILVDGGPTINNSQEWSSGEIAFGGFDNWNNIFDNDTTTGAVSVSRTQLIFPAYVPFSQIEVSASQRFVVITDTGTYECTNLPASWLSTTGYTNVTSLVDGTEMRGFIVESSGCIVAGIKIDGKVLVNGTPSFTGGTYNTLYQTWSEWVITTLRTASAEADALKLMLRSHAQTYSAGEDYCEGSVIKAFGQLWIAINDAPATTFADLPAITAHPNWEHLNISA